MKRAAAFSLVELSIVLVILGLLVGGVLSGQALIHAAQLRDVTEEYRTHSMALNTFRDKYFAMAGDLTNGTAFWGKDNAKCAGDSGTAATPGTCNGNGDGNIDFGGGAGTTAEMFQLWKQLGLAGLISGTYTGAAGSGGGQNAIVGTNVPASKFTNAGWSILRTDMAFTGDAYSYDYTNSAIFSANFYTFGAATPVYSTYYPAISAEDLWNIDTKMDDGKPAQGTMTAWNWGDCTTSSSKTDFNGVYKFTYSDARCSLRIKIK